MIALRETEQVVLLCNQTLTCIGGTDIPSQLCQLHKHMSTQGTHTQDRKGKKEGGRGRRKGNKRQEEFRSNFLKHHL